MFNSNQVTIRGVVGSKFQFSHEAFGDEFYTVDVLVTRFSGTVDRIPVMVSKSLTDVSQDLTGKYVKIYGHFRSLNRQEGDHRRLILYVFTRDLRILEKADNFNSILLEGYLCRPPIYRKTPSGREISDLLVAVHRASGKSDYIPCICWRENAQFAATLNVGDRVRLNGRIQSREYIKKGEETPRVAYEVSASGIEADGEDEPEEEDTTDNEQAPES